MKYLIIEKLSDGRIQATAWINADGSPTVTIFKNAQEAKNALPVFDKSVSGLGIDSDRATLSFKQDGTVDTLDVRVYSKTKDEEGQSAILTAIDPALDSKISLLKNDVSVKSSAAIAASDAEASADSGGAIINP